MERNTERIKLKKKAINPKPTIDIILLLRMSPLPEAASIIRIMPSTVAAAEIVSSNLLV